ncbi:hypothetical protein [Pseudomonas syringae]|uniref:Uncharacterized protein n=1 Tax=Pseudomonas syringae pv. daphniphylli TaxID=264455 RepID=A0A9X0KXR8_PSESX|nr:hypothetical protein [Pseudomonas syringae]KPX18407.1 hypothetical protein ALO73_100628 [Pseudomonas syringae pv. daphniphylli]KWS86421.1 hypothetical protein AL050_25280 [Pseudomonas syringae pv. daphniphylli]
MSEHETLPSTARDALIIELLSDVGRLHDDVKRIPKLLEISMRDSLDIVADAVEDAEETALLLQDSTKEVIQATAAKAGVDVALEMSTAIHQSLERVFEPALHRAAMKIDDLEKRITHLSGNIRDAHAARFNYIVLAGFVVVTIVMMCAMGWIAITSQDVNETNKWFYNEYKNQRALIDTLPPALKKRFVQ